MYKIDNWTQEGDMFFATVYDPKTKKMVDVLHQLNGDTWLRSQRDFQIFQGNFIHIN